MRLLGLIVAKNESQRYLESCLTHMVPLFDAVMLFDDMSDDNTMEMAFDLGCYVDHRLDTDKSFIESEGHFRYAAWQAMESMMRPKMGDWIFSFDADEFLISTEGDTRGCLKAAATEAEAKNLWSVVIPIPEIFDPDPPQQRVDGYWGRIQGTRFFKYDRGGEWKLVDMACDSEPTYVKQRGTSHSNFGLHLLHYGYADERDRNEKYERYISRGGHNNAHVQSILTTPKLKKWEGPVPSVQRAT